MKVKSESEVAQSCPTLSDSMDCSPPGSSVHGIFQARVLEWGATAFSNEVYKIDKFMETESRMMVAGTGEGGNNYLMGTEFPFGKMEKSSGD